MPYDIDNPMILAAYTLARGPSLDDDCPEHSPFEEELAEKLNQESHARRVRNRQEEHPAIDAYEERQIERAMGGKDDVNSGTEINRNKQGNDIQRMAG